LGEFPAVTGKVTIDGEPATKAAITHIALLSARSSAVQIENDGSFRLRGIAPGTYRIRVYTEGSAWVRSIRQNGRDVTRGEIVVGESAPEPLEIDLGAKGGTVRGIVALPASQAPPAVMVNLFRRMDSKLVFEKQTYVVLSHVEAQGEDKEGVIRSSAFTLEGVAPGEYTVLAWPAEAQPDYADPQFIQRYGDRGKAISVQEGTTTTVAVDAIAAAEPGDAPL